MLFTSATAANGSSYANGRRERTVPIPSTITPIAGYPRKLVIFKMAASKFWQVRCWVAGRTHRKSTQSQSAQVARHFARQFYEQRLADHRIANLDAQVNSDNACRTAPFRSHLKITSDSSVKANDWTPDAPLPTPSFAVYADHLLRKEQARVDRREYTLGSLQILRNRLEG
jgi:hypothetical protein